MRDLAYNPKVGDLIIKDGDFYIASEENTAEQNGVIMMSGSIISTFNPIYGVNMNVYIGQGENATKRGVNWWSSQMNLDGATNYEYSISEIGSELIVTPKNISYPTTTNNIPTLTIPNFTPTTKSFTYTVYTGETIVDVCIKTTGNISNIQKILDANDFGSASPVLTNGQIIKIPAGVIIDSNTLNQLQNFENTNFSDSGFMPFDKMQELALDFQNSLPIQNP